MGRCALLGIVLFCVACCKDRTVPSDSGVQPSTEGAAESQNQSDKSEWPGPDAVFAWHNAAEETVAREQICRVQPKAGAQFGRRFDMAPGTGSFIATRGAKDLKLGASPLTIEAVLTAASKPGSVFQWRKFSLAQALGEWQLRYVSDGGVRLMRFGSCKPGQASHLWLRISEESCEAWIDGERQSIRTSLVGSQIEEQEDDGELIFGPGWGGRLERVAVYLGEVDPAFASKSFLGADLERNNTVKGAARIRARLVEPTPIPTTADLKTYRSALVHHLYDVLEVLEGELEAERITIAHWALMDRKRVKGLPTKVDKEIEVYIEPLAANPQLESARFFNELSDVDAPLYFDTTPPTVTK